MLSRTVLARQPGGRECTGYIYIPSDKFVSLKLLRVDSRGLGLNSHVPLDSYMCPLDESSINFAEALSACTIMCIQWMLRLRLLTALAGWERVLMRCR